MLPEDALVPWVSRLEVSRLAEALFPQLPAICHPRASSVAIRLCVIEESPSSGASCAHFNRNWWLVDVKES